MNKILLNILLIMLFIYKCGNDKTIESQNTFKVITKITDKTQRFISVNDMFTSKNEFIFKPIKMLEHPKTLDIIVLDDGNHSMYLFNKNENGNIILKKRVGSAGEGPGDLLMPYNMFIGKDDNIYVYEYGNNRISVFDERGKFIYTKKINIILPTRQPQSNFIVDGNNVIFNLPKGNHYLTLINLKDDTINDLGKIDIYKNANSIIFAECRIFSNDSNYILFLDQLPIIKKYDKSGKIIMEKNIESFLDIPLKYYPWNKNFDGSFAILYNDIIKKDNYYYLLKLLKDFSIYLYILDNDFNFINKYEILFDNNINFGRENPNICLINSGKTLLMANPYESEIYNIITFNNNK